MTPAAAVALAAGLALAGRAIGWLTPSGTVAAALVGAAIFTGGGLPGAALLALFFVSGSALTYRSGTSRAELPMTQRHGRTGRQVLANGAWAAAGALLLTVGEAGWAVMAGALATAQADTWATEIGARATRPTRLITSGRPVTPGTSGGVTALGTAGGLLGATLMGGLAALLGIPTAVALAAVTGGILGMLADSVLGATLQGVYYCDRCAMQTEWAVHRCGERARPVRGLRWVGNDGVNFVATGLGAAVAIALY
jgi:uncharacterized protein (TIGR00297 family)